MKNSLHDIAKWIRYQILISTTTAGSGHPTTSLSATDLMTGLFFDGFFKFDIKNTQNPNNDRLIFSKGHGSPLFYALWAAAGAFDKEELRTLRKFGSRLEGHPTSAFPYTEAATGSLGQGLSIGLGMALNAKYLDKLPYRTYILLGDGELAEGQVWEAAELAARYKLNNLIAILDINRLGQSGPTMHEWDTKNYQDKFTAFGWNTVVIDGHDFDEIHRAYRASFESNDKPTVIIAKTKKGRGVSFIEDKPGWHGKALSKDELVIALEELGPIEYIPQTSLAIPESIEPQMSDIKTQLEVSIDNSKKLATRKAYGIGLVELAKKNSSVVALDAETRNSTFSETFMKAFPDRFFEMYIAEQNMVGAAIGLSGRGKIPFVSTFAAFFSRAYDQIRMSQYSGANIKLCGSHAGVSIGEDGSSQMGLEDIAMMRSILDSVVVYPSDAHSTVCLIEEAAKHHGLVYLRTTRADTAHLYDSHESFPIGGSKTLKTSTRDAVTLVSAGITLHEALAAYDSLQKEDIIVRVIDLYSIKPIDYAALKKAHDETNAIITIEDHYPAGGIGSAVNDALSALPNRKPIYQLSVTKEPKSGKPGELLSYEEIDAEAIVKKVREIV